MLTNPKICAFSQFQQENLSEMEQNAQKNNSHLRRGETVSNPIKFSCQNALKI
jgi:hypothetical protein